MATQTVTGLENELKLLVEDVERMQNEHPDEEFPPEIAAMWDFTNRKIQETKKQLELARRNERMDELKRSAPSAQENEGTLAHFQVGNSQWREDPYNVSNIERSFDPEKEGQQFRDRAKLVLERDINFQHPVAKPDEAKHEVT